MTDDTAEVTAETVPDEQPPIVTDEIRMAILAADASRLYRRSFDVMSTNTDRSLDELHDVISSLAGLASRIAAAINARAKGGR